MGAGKKIIRSACLRRKVKIGEVKLWRSRGKRVYIYIYIRLCLVPRFQQPLSETRQLAVLRSCSAVFRVIYSREMARFLVYILEREPHYFVHPVICPLVVCPDPSPLPYPPSDSCAFSERLASAARYEAAFKPPSPNPPVHFLGLG